jgi:hypothetical protein
MSWVNGLIPYLYDNAAPKTRNVPIAEIAANPNTYAMSRHAYEASWLPLTKEPYEQFGRAFSNQSVLDRSFFRMSRSRGHDVRARASALCLRCKKVLRRVPRRAPAKLSHFNHHKTVWTVKADARSGS